MAKAIEYGTVYQVTGGTLHAFVPRPADAVDVDVAPDGTVTIPGPDQPPAPPVEPGPAPEPAPEPPPAGAGRPRKSAGPPGPIDR